jgi:hypothetical protein
MYRMFCGCFCSFGPFLRTTYFWFERQIIYNDHHYSDTIRCAHYHAQSTASHFVPNFANLTDTHLNDHKYLLPGYVYPKNANHAPGGGGDHTNTLPLPSGAKATNFVVEALPPLHMHAAHNAQFSSAYVSSDNLRNISICRNIPSDIPVNLTSGNTLIYTTESSFGNSHQRPSNESVNFRNIPSTAAANIPMHRNISSSCPRDRSNNVMTNSTAHFSMGCSHEDSSTLPPVRCATSVAECNHTWSSGPSMQVTRNQTNGDYGSLRNMQINQVRRVDSTAQA